MEANPCQSGSEVFTGPFGEHVSQPTVAMSMFERLALAQRIGVAVSML